MPRMAPTQDKLLWFDKKRLKSWDVGAARSKGPTKSVEGPANLLLLFSREDQSTGNGREMRGVAKTR